MSVQYKFYGVIVELSELFGNPEYRKLLTKEQEEKFCVILSLVYLFDIKQVSPQYRCDPTTCTHEKVQMPYFGNVCRLEEFWIKYPIMQENDLCHIHEEVFETPLHMYNVDEFQILPVGHDLIEKLAENDAKKWNVKSTILRLVSSPNKRCTRMQY